jgi:hypothetical protein
LPIPFRLEAAAAAAVEDSTAAGDFMAVDSTVADSMAAAGTGSLPDRVERGHFPGQLAALRG